MENNQQTFVCIDEDEFERLKSNEFLLLTLKSFQNNNINNINKEIDQEIKYKLQKIEKRQIEYEQFVYELNGELRSLEMESQRRVKAQNEKFHLLRKEYYSLLQQERDEYINLFDIHDKKLTTLIEEEAKTRDKAVSELEIKIDSMIEDKINKQERVNNFILELVKMFQEVEKIPHDIYAKNRFAELKSYIPEIIQDFKSEFYETSLNSARQVYKKLSELKDTVLQKEQEYLTIYYAALKKIRFIIEKIKLNKNVIVSIKNLQIEMDIDYWNYQNVTKLENEITKIYENFINNTKLNITDIETIIKDINERENKFNYYINKSKEDMILSQIRFNIAQRIAQELRKYLFTVYDSGYLNNDLRSDYFIDLKNRIGEKINIIIKKSDDKNINEIFITSNSNNYNSKFISDFIWQ